MAECLRSEGWDITLRPDNGISLSLPEAQGSAYEQAIADCEKKFGYDIPPPPMTDDEIRELYKKVLNTAQCLQNLGKTQVNPPSEQEFIDQSHDIGPWDPYIDIYIPGQITDQEYFELITACPRTW